MYMHQSVGGNVVVKSGCDFRNVSYIKVKAGQLSPEEKENVPSVVIDDSNVKTDQEYFYELKGGEFKIKIQKWDITKSIEPDVKIKEQIAQFYEELDKELKVVNCFLDAELDTKFSSIRTKETPIGNFLADLMMREHNSDCAIMNGGNIRADQIYDAGKFTVGDWNDLLPFLVPVVKIEVSGAQLLGALENSVSKWPAMEGRFLQISGISFAFDPSKPSGERVAFDSVKIKENALVLTNNYTVATSDYVANGKDGFNCLDGCKIVIDEENAPLLKDIVLDFFCKSF